MQFLFQELFSHIDKNSGEKFEDMFLVKIASKRTSLRGLYTGKTKGKNQALVGAIPFCGEYHGPRFEDKFRSANKIDGISKLAEIKWLPVNL